MSASRGSNCAANSTDTRCTVTVPVARLILSQAFIPAVTTPGSVIRLTSTFTNTGQVPYTGITVSSPISTDLLDDAIPNGDQTTTSGSLTITARSATWTGTIPIGGVITNTGTLTVRNPDPGNKTITSTLVATVPGNNCSAGSRRHQMYRDGCGVGGRH